MPPRLKPSKDGLCGSVDTIDVVSGDSYKVTMQYLWASAKPKLPEECFTWDGTNINLEAMDLYKPKEVVRKTIFKKGDRVILTRSILSDLGPHSEGIVKRNCYDRYDSVAVDFVRAHDRNGNRNTKPWNGGHDCQGWVPMRNGRYYGHWVDVSYLKKIDSTSDDDILLLI